MTIFHDVYYITSLLFDQTLDLRTLEDDPISCSQGMTQLADELAGIPNSPKIAFKILLITSEPIKYSFSHKDFSVISRKYPFLNLITGIKYQKYAHPPHKKTLLLILSWLISSYNNSNIMNINNFPT